MTRKITSLTCVEQDLIIHREERSLNESLIIHATQSLIHQAITYEKELGNHRRPATATETISAKTATDRPLILPLALTAPLVLLLLLLDGFAVSLVAGTNSSLVTLKQGICVRN
jgi:hypothetical protein